MPLLQVRDFPDDLYEELKKVAKMESRSVARQTVVIMKDYLEQKKQRETDSEAQGFEVQDSDTQDFEALVSDSQSYHERLQQTLKEIHELHKKYDSKIPKNYDSVAAIREWRERDQLSRTEHL